MLPTKQFFGPLMAATLVACGGGDGGNASGPANPGPVSLRTASAFAGTYASPCFAVPNGSNYESGDALYAKPFLTVFDSPGSTARVSFRLDFYDDPTCAQEPLGSLKNENVANLLSLHGDVPSGSRVASRIQLDFQPSGAAHAAGPTNDTLLYGTALRLKLPEYYLTGFRSRDLWLLDGSALYEGTYTIGDDGYPLALEATASTGKVAYLPVAPAKACAASTLSWSGTTMSCFANAAPSASGRKSLLSDAGSGRAGEAQFSCQEGVWQAPTNAYCAATPAIPERPGCPAQAISWSEGTESCSGNLPWSTAGSFTYLHNTLAGKFGGGVWSCSANGSWELWRVNEPPTCSLPPPPPPPPPITDPQELARARNCLNCHAVTGPGFSIFGGPTLPSFETIAAYYRANPASVAAIASRVKAGSSGVFGSAAMPANPQASDADLAIILPWVLAQPP